MSSKVKPYHTKHPKQIRNYEARDMIFQGQEPTVKRERRAHEKRDWQQETESYN